VSVADLRLPGRFRAVVFDMDGLLVDSEPSWAAAEAELFARHGRPFGPGDVLDTHGRSVETTLAIHAERLAKPRDLLLAEMLDSVRRRYETDVPIRPGAADLVAFLHGRLPMAVASNSPLELVDLGLRRHGLRDAIDHIVTADDVPRAKPAPDVYVEACARLGVPVSDILALEDSVPGVQAAKAAGLMCVGVPERLGIDLIGAGADLVIASLSDIAIADRQT
jgi:HAD superfamily hydrolase (TIGR01509 family)